MDTDMRTGFARVPYRHAVRTAAGLACLLTGAAALGQTDDHLVTDAFDVRTSAAPGEDPRSVFEGGMLCEEGACVEPCEGMSEGEPNCDFESQNGGCSEDDGFFTFIELGETFCGTTRATNNTRDTDWYEFEVDKATEVTIELEAEFPAVFLLFEDNCEPLFLIEDGTTGVTCETGTIETTLPEGEYYIFVAPGEPDGDPIFNGIPCGCAYSLSLAGNELLGACCVPSGDTVECLDDESFDDCTTNLNGIFFDGMTCGEVDCPQGGVPENDDCSNASLLKTGAPVMGSTAFADFDDVPQCFGINISGPGVWYRVLGDGSTFTASTSGSTFPSRLHVFTNTDPTGGCGGTFCCRAADAGDAAPSNCCMSLPGPGCENEGCESLVCTTDPFCCESQWDGLCADLAEDVCGDLCELPEQGDASVSWCTEPNEEYYVLVSGIQNTFGTFTIGVTSDEEDCVPMRGACNECPPESVTEPEPCGQDVNGGCNDPAPDFTPIALGDTYCGTAWANNGDRDTDWYELTLAEQTTITLTLEPDFEALLLLLNDDCENQVVLRDETVLPCTQSVISETLDAGTYRIFVGQTVGDGASCDNGNACGFGVNYTLSAELCQYTCEGGTQEADACVIGDPGTFKSNCCVPNGSPGCEDFNCQAQVCASDPFCCQTEWDGSCAQIAKTVCPALCEPVNVIEDPNGGCGESPPQFYEIACGETICGQAPTGTTAAGDPIRDTDWYSFEVAETCKATVELEAGFQAASFLFRVDNCNAPMNMGGVYAMPCQGVETSEEIELTPGTYAVFVAAATEEGGPIFNGVTCDLNAAYRVTLSCDCDQVETGACCMSACDCASGITEAACIDMGGVFRGAGSACGESGACPGCPGDLTLDGQVDSADLNQLLGFFGSGDEGDLDCDGDTDSADLNLLLGEFGDICEPVGMGACCLSPCDCVEGVSESSCGEMTGVFRGVGVACGEAGSCPGCPGDATLDGQVDSADLNQVLGFFGSGSGGDLDCDGTTDSADLNLVLGAFGEVCGTP